MDLLICPWTHLKINAFTTLLAGSTSPAKVQAAESAFRAAFSTHTVTIHSVATDSGVSAQPLTDAETRQGAINRAHSALAAAPTAASAASAAVAALTAAAATTTVPSTAAAATAAAAAATTAAATDTSQTVDYAVGVEGGVEMIDGTMQCFSWTAVIAADTGVLALSRSGSFAVHPRVQALVLAGTELGAACDAVYDTAQGKGAGGLIGVMTQGLVTRKQLYSHALLLALTRFTAPVLEPN
jgi:inosine/xanthosine triphosphatase